MRPDAASSNDAHWLRSLWPDRSDWTGPLNEHLNGPSFAALSIFLADQSKQRTIYPSPDKIFAAFELTPLAKTKVVILGQDPYHGPGQAQGLSFSVPASEKLPPSLRNIYKELATDIGGPTSTNGDLTHWARQGVLLLNTVLTVEASQANSHKQRGWEDFTDAVIAAVNDSQRPIVFLLWGKPAAKKSAMIDDRHFKILSPHPSPLSAYRGFFGSRPFSTANEALVASSQSEIRWIANPE